VLIVISIVILNISYVFAVWTSEKHCPHPNGDFIEVTWEDSGDMLIWISVNSQQFIVTEKSSFTVAA